MAQGNSRRPQAHHAVLNSRQIAEIMTQRGHAMSPAAVRQALAVAERKLRIALRELNETHPETCWSATNEPSTKGQQTNAKDSAFPPQP